MNAADRLARLLEEKEHELAELRETIEDDRDNERWRWARHSELPKEQSLPVPRLEMVVEGCDDGSFERVWTYRMVYRHLLGHCVAVPLGCTVQRGTMSRSAKEMLPFRDGCHFRHDAEAFGWPAFIICGDVVEEYGKESTP